MRLIGVYLPKDLYQVYRKLYVKRKVPARLIAERASVNTTNLKETRYPEKIYIRVMDDTHKKLKRLAEIKRTTVSQIIRNELEEEGWDNGLL